MPYTQSKPLPVAAASKVWVCGSPLSGIAGSNLAGTWMSLMSVVCCVGAGLLG